MRERFEDLKFFAMMAFVTLGGTLATTLMR